MQRKILFLANYNDEDYKGGIANILECYCENLSLFNKYNYDVEWLNLKTRHSKNKFFSLIQKIKVLFQEKRVVYREIERIKPNLIHIHTSRGFTLYKDLMIAKYLKKKTSLPIALSIHFAEFSKIFSKRKMIKKREIKIADSFVDKIICLSRVTAKELSTLFGDKKISILYTFHTFNSADKILENSNNSALRLMFMGSLNERKGILDLILAVQKLKNRVVLKIYGGFDSDQVFQKRFYDLLLGNSAIEYCGYISGLDKEKAFSKSDIFILPSYAEGMPIVIMEALSKGCAIISTNVGAIPEIVTEENGILLSPGDINGIYLAIEKYDNNRNLLMAVRKNNLKKGKQFSLSSNIKALCDIYGGLFNDKQ